MEAQVRLNYLTTVFNVDASVLDELAQHRMVVVVPAYDEERFIGSVILKILQFPVTVIVVDDGSSDATSLVAASAGALVIRYEHNLVNGFSLNTGILEARKLQPEVIVVIDGDGQHLVCELPRLVQPILTDEADVVVGSRYLEHFSQVPAHRPCLPGEDHRLAIRVPCLLTQSLQHRPLPRHQFLG